MRKLLCLLPLVAALLAPIPAVAGERLIGTIVSAGGADQTNAGTAAPFIVPFSQKLTIWCNAQAYIAVDTTTASTATSGAQPVAALEKFPTSTGSQSGSGAVVITVGGLPSAVVRISGPAAVTCYVSTRLGTE